MQEVIANIFMIKHSTVRLCIAIIFHKLEMNIT